MKLLRRRAKMMRDLRRFFDELGYLEVDTPALVPSPGVEPHLLTFEVPSAQRHLNTSPEYHMKRLLARGSGPIWQVAKVFRAEEHGKRHNPEFSMLEWYVPGFDRDALLTQTCDLLAAVGVVDDPAAVQTMSVAEALRRHAGVELAALTGPDRLERWSWLMATEVEPRLDGLVALVDYPADMASRARLDPDDPTIARRFEIYVDGVELANGFEELTDPVEQRARMEVEAEQRRAMGVPALPLDERFLEALGDVPPCAGVAVGVDRLAMLAAGVDDVRSVMAFSWWQA